MNYKVQTAALHITQACTHHCSFCYATSFSKAKQPPYAILADVIRAIASEGVQELVFLGGDPCEHPQLLDLCEIAKNKGMSTVVLSNTHDYNTDDVTRIVNLVDVFETTFHGDEPSIHDSIAGVDGAFSHVVQRLSTLAQSGARSIGMVYNINPRNVHSLYRTVKNLIEHYKIPLDHLLLQRIIPQGRGQATSEFVLGIPDVLVAMTELERIYDEYGIDISFEDPVPFCTVPEQYHKFLERCRWGFTHVALDWQGNVSRCGADPRYQLGNVLETPLTEIWNSSPVLANFRSRQYLPDECQHCDLLEVCGGCALSCELDGDHGPDYLYFEKETDASIITSITSMNLRPAIKDDLSDILRIEWASFPNYEHKFSPVTLQKWFRHNSSMFHVLQASNGFIYGYACLVPLTNRGFHKISKGLVSSLTEMSFSDVEKNGTLSHPYWHIEVIAALKVQKFPAGRVLIHDVGQTLLEKGAKILTTSPITQDGFRLCQRFGFRKVASESTDEGTYDIYALDIEKGHFAEIIRGLR